MLTTPFLTQLDSRAQIKGSRDPLGVQPIWSRFGRRVVGNLTTVSSSVRDFTVLLLGYYFAERVAEDRGSQGDLATFLKWEQLAAYARAHRNGETGFRGTERVHARLQEGERVQLGLDSTAQILGNQKIYGLWGLYSVPARASGLLTGDPPRLTPPARDLIHRVHLPIFAEFGIRDAKAVVERLRAPGCTIHVRAGSKDTALLDAVAKILGRPRARERELYREHLLFGGPEDSARGTRGAQRLFAELLAETLDERAWTLSPPSVADLAKKAARRGSIGEDLARLLYRIRVCEQLIAPAVAFYEYVLSCDGQTPGHIASEVQRQWGAALRGTIDLEATEELEDGLRVRPDDPESGQRWVRLAYALGRADYGQALRLLLEQNAAVMNARGAAAPWAEIIQGKLVVRFRDEQLTKLPRAEGLPSYWRHAYFIGSLRAVARELRG